MQNKQDNSEKPPSWFQQLFNRKPTPVGKSRDSLIEDIREAHKEGLLDDDTLKMIEGVMKVDHEQARDIMLPKSQIHFIHRNSNYRDILKQVMQSGHSRYPVIDESRDDIEGILHTKDLLKYIGRENEFDIDDIMRDAVYATESQRLDTLLTEFRDRRSHMAVVIDEYGGLSGLVTIEDILEEIVGDIVDEHDLTETPEIQDRQDGSFSVLATTNIEDVNEYFDLHLETNQFDTIGGLITHSIGNIPKKGEETVLENCQFTVLDSDGRRIHQLRAIPMQQKQEKMQVA
ncbi:MAG: Magnesium and cobalt efflux protein CorC [uncultured Thiotrichaceae bacterium]|uniref:Magnesium and cobalt efflux protein CorC n=1 Tax=uncultured Thiotrichaceae bacterium TaxID=298394 RepID=A0A6S6SQC7_9GAMM|nr:MAG: Magnesium and cobalt efflux protein CorC [uncultured Thiotrichaceae bacterium]